MLRYIQGNVLQLANCCGVRKLFTNHRQQFIWIQVCPHFTVVWEKKGKQLLARRVASIRWWIEKSGMPPCFLHLSPCVNQPLCHSTRKRGGGIMSSYLFCTKMKYLSGVNTYQEQTIGQGASSSQTHIWLPPPQRPNHVLRVFSDSGKSASFESTFQSPCWTGGLCWNWRETCVHTL